MKKLFIPVVALLLGLVLFLACGETGTGYQNEQSEIPTEIIQICEDHNEGLEYIYNGLREADDLSDVYQQIEILVEDYNISKYAETNYVMSANDGYNYGATILNRYYNEIQLNKTSNNEENSSSYYQYILNSLSDSLSYNQINLLYEIDSIFSENTLKNSIELINEIKDNRIPSFPADEQGILYLAAEMGIYSSTYWSENLNDWITFFQDSSMLGKQSAWFDWWEVGAADVGTALGAVITSAVIVVGSAGTAAPIAGLYIVGAAVGGSAVSAAIQIMNHIKN